MTSKNPALYYCLQACDESRGGELQDFFKGAISYSSCAYMTAAGRPRGHADETPVPSKVAQRSRRDCSCLFFISSHQLPTHRCCQLCSPERSAKPLQWRATVFFFLFFFLPSSTAGSSSLFFVCSDEIWATLADTKEHCEHVHYKSNHLERHNSAKRRGCDSCQLSQEKSIKFTFSLCSI